MLRQRLTSGAQKTRVRTLPELVIAVGEGAAYLAQGSSYSYIRARSGTMAPRLMQDAGFSAGMERCKWEGFAAMVGDLILIVETEMRPHGPVAPAIWSRLYREVLAAQKMPSHRAESGWSDRIAAFDMRLAAHGAMSIRGIESLCEHSAEVLLEFTPVDETIRKLDREMVVNNVKFRFIGFIDALRRRADWPALATAIGAGAEGRHP